MLGGGNADQCRGVAGEQEAVRAKIAVARRAGRTDAGPQRQRAEEQLALRCEQRDQEQRRDEAHERAADPVEALGEHSAALRLHDDEHGGHGGARLWQIEPHRNAEREKRGGQRLEQVDPGAPIGAHPFDECGLQRRKRAHRGKRGKRGIRHGSRPIASRRGTVHRLAPRGRRRAHPSARRRRRAVPRGFAPRAAARLAIAFRSR